MTIPTPRPYQIEAQQALRGFVQRGVRRIVLQCPTGGGKTIIAAFLIRSAVAKRKRVLFGAPRKELVNQCSNKLDLLGIHHGIVMSRHSRCLPSLPVQVASIPTLVRRLDNRSWDFDLIIMDECHRSLAATHMKILEAFPKAVVIGLTATPERSDGRGLGEFYQAMVQASTVQKLTELGNLVPSRVWAPSRPDLTGVRIARGDYDETDLAELMNRPDLVGNIPRHWKELAANRTTVAFAVNIRHSIHIRDSFRAAGVRAEHLDGTTPDRERDTILERLASGDIQVVSNVGILTEGWDCPLASCCILARPTMSTGLYQQMVGRVLRPSSGKPDAIILDHAGCVHEHGMPDEDRQYSLEGSKRKRKKPGQRNTPRAQTCEKCFAAFPMGTRKCPGCGWSVYVAARPNPTIDDRARLKEISQVQAREKRNLRVRKDLERYQQIAASKGYKSGWIFHRMKHQYGAKLTKQIMGSQAA